MDFETIMDFIDPFGQKDLTFWVLRLCGEAGELANKVAKMDDRHMYIISELEDELADVFITTVLVAKKMNIDLENAILNKIDRVKRREGHFGTQ